jgi:hypothetical protein
MSNAGSSNTVSEIVRSSHVVLLSFNCSNVVLLLCAVKSLPFAVYILVLVVICATERTIQILLSLHTHVKPSVTMTS